MNYDEFESYFIKQNKILLPIAICSLVINAVLLFMYVTSERYFVNLSGDIFNRELMLQSVCIESFNSLVSTDPSPNLITSGILEIVKKNPFDVGDFKVIKLTVNDQDQCHLIIKTESKLRSFRLSFLKDSGYAFYYQLDALDELNPKDIR